MGIYDDLRNELAAAAREHLKTIALLNAYASSFRTDFEQRLGAPTNHLLLVQKSDEGYIQTKNFPAHEGRNEIIATYVVQFQIGPNEVISEETTVKLRADSAGLYATVEGNAEHLCGPLGGPQNKAEWQAVVDDFVNVLQHKVKNVTSKTKI